MTDRCAIFVRTSTAEQSADSQLADLRPYATHRGWQVVSEIKLEGTSAYRGGMDALLARLVRESKRDGWSILLIHSLDRLSRRGVVQTVHAVTRLAEAGIRLTSYREADMIDLSSPHGELVLSVFAFLARQESAIKSERAKEASKTPGQRESASDVRLARRTRRSGHDDTSESQSGDRLRNEGGSRMYSDGEFDGYKGEFPEGEPRRGLRADEADGGVGDLPRKERRPLRGTGRELHEAGSDGSTGLAMGNSRLRATRHRPRLATHAVCQRRCAQMDLLGETVVLLPSRRDQVKCH